MLPNKDIPSEMQEIRAMMLKRLRERRYKLTPQRLEIIDIISGNKTHPSAQDLLTEARKRNPQISFSTVYYTLNLLKKEGLIKEIGFYDKANRYDSVTNEHINLICLKCGGIEDFDEAIPLSFDKITKKTGFEPFDTRLEYYGYCRECRQKKR